MICLCLRAKTALLAPLLAALLVAFLVACFVVCWFVKRKKLARLDQLAGKGELLSL